MCCCKDNPQLLSESHWIAVATAELQDAEVPAVGAEKSTEYATVAPAVSSSGSTGEWPSERAQGGATTALGSLLNTRDRPGKRRLRVIRQLD